MGAVGFPLGFQSSNPDLISQFENATSSIKRTKRFDSNELLGKNIWFELNLFKN